MTPSARGRPVLPIAVSTGLFLLVVTAALLPNLGIVAASSNCTYGSCTSSSPPNYSLYYAVLAVLAILAIAFGILLMLRRRRSSPSPAALSEAEPMGGSGPTGPGDEGTMDAAVPVAAVASTAAASPMVPPGAGGADYLEGPEDVGATLPAPSVPAAAAAAPAAGAAAGGEADIDSLMQELDKISGEILKRPPVKKDGDGSSPSADDEGTQSG